MLIIQFLINTWINEMEGGLFLIRCFKIWSFHKNFRER